MKSLNHVIFKHIKARGDYMCSGIYNSGVTKPSYKNELHIMTSQTELPTLKFYNFLSCEKNFKIVLELVTRDF